MDSGNLFSIIQKMKEQQLKKKSAENLDNDTTAVGEVVIKPTEPTRSLENEVFDKIRTFCKKMNLPTTYNNFVGDESADKFVGELMSTIDEYLILSDAKPEDETPVTPIDAKPVFYVSADSMSGYFFILPPLHGGEAIDMETMDLAIAERGITHGVDKKIVENAVNSLSYCQVTKFANGIEPVDGDDGRIEQIVSIKTGPNFVEDIFGNVDLRNLNMVNEIEENTELCRVFHATEGVDGVNIEGVPLDAKAGFMPTIPQGNNTHFAEDGTLLLSSIKGALSFVNEMYNVENVLTINGNVDLSVGNLTFGGDIYIKGDVGSGFVINADGGIFVEGIVGDSTLIAKSDIVISKGVNGDSRGNLSAGGTIKCKFIEQCHVYCGASIVADTIINCTVQCLGSVITTSGKGVLAGGSCTAFDSVSAKIIGSKANTPTNIVIERSPKFANAKAEIEKKIAESKEILAKLVQNLNSLVHGGVENLDQNKKMLLAQLIQQRKLYDEKIAELESDLDDVVAQEYDYSKCRIKGTTIHAPTKMQIGSGHYSVRNEVHMASYYLNKEGQIELGTL